MMTWWFLTCAFLGVHSNTTVTSDKLLDFTNSLETLRIKAKIPGLSVAIVKDGTLLMAQGLGVANISTGKAATADTAYDIASVTKPLSVAFILKLVEQGIVDLDQPMSSYSNWAGFCSSFAEQPSIFAKNLECQPHQHTLRHLLTHTAIGTPGHSFSYNPVLFSWASRPIMSLTGKAFSSQLSEVILQPLRMENSARRHRKLALPDHVATNLAPPHRLNEGGRIVLAPALKPQGDGAAGGIISTVVDLATFDMALDRGEIISQPSLNRMMTPAVANDGRLLPYGLGWFLEEFEGVSLAWHSGWWEKAYSAIYLKVPSQKLSLILLANSEGLWWDNPLDKAEIYKSPFAQLFLKTFVKPKQR